MGEDLRQGSGAVEGSSFGDYVLLEEIARGGMGVVWRARQRSLDREVALKMALGAELTDPEARRRLQREAHAAASLHHPNIVPVYEIGEHQSQTYFTMRLVPGGENIAQWAAGRRKEHRTLAGAVAAIARALAYAHDRGVLHRDLKPSNVLWDPDGGPQVTDFGLARWLDDPLSSLSGSGRILGTPSYMAPEQVRGRAGEVTIATDVYGLGAILYELLTGEPPFRAATSHETMRRVESDPPERPTRRVPAIPRDLETICLKCLEKEPAQRYASARALAEELERFGRGESIQARRVPVAVQFARWVRRNPALAGSLGGALVLLLAGLVGVTWQWRTAEQARRGERQAREEALARVTDLLVKSGFDAAEKRDPSRAALWFAHAAEASGGQPARQALNRLRWRTWRDDAFTAVRAFPADTRERSRLAWHPAQTALLVQNTFRANVSVWQLAEEARWRPELTFTFAQWLPRSGNLAVLHGGILRVLEFPSGRELARCPQLVERGPDEGQLAVSPDDRWVAVSATGPLLWDTHHGVVHALPMSPDRPTPADKFTPRAFPNLPGVVQVEFSRDGRCVLLTGRGWRGTCALAEPTRFAAGPVDSTHFDEFGFLAEGDRFVALADSPELRTFDSTTGALLARQPLPDAPQAVYLPVRPSPDGRFLAQVGLPLVEIATGRARKIPAHKNSFFAQDFSRDESLLASVSIDDTARLWRLDEDGPGELIGWHQESPVCVSISPDQRLIATGQMGGGLVRVWRRPIPAAPRSIPTNGLTRVHVSPDGQWILPSGWTGEEARMDRTRVVRASTLAPGPELAPGGLLMDAAFGPEAEWVVLAVSAVPAADRPRMIAQHEVGSGSVEIWNSRTGERVGVPVLLPVEPRAVAVHPSGSRIGIYGPHRSLLEVERKTGVVRLLQPPVPRPSDFEQKKQQHCAYSSDGRVLLGWGQGGPPVLWLSGTGRALPTPHLEGKRLWSAAFLGSMLATGSQMGQMDFTDLLDGKPLGASLPEVNWLFFARFDPAGRLLLTGGRGRAARVWDWRERRLEGNPMLHEDEVFSATFVPASPFVVTGCRDRRLYFWDYSSGQLVRPPLDQLEDPWNLIVLADGSLLLNQQIEHGRPSLGVIDLAALLAPPTLAVEDALHLASIDAAAVIENSALKPLTAEAWLQRWQEFRRRHPEWHPWK